MLRTETPVAIRLQDYTPPGYLIDHVDLDFKLDGMKTRVAARLSVRRNAGTRAHEPLVFDGDSLNADRIAVNGAIVESTSVIVTPDSLTLLEPPAEAFTLEIDTTLAPDLNTRLMGLYRTGGVYCTQCEAEGFRRITYFPDRPDVLATYKVRVEANKAEAPVLLSNGNPVEYGDLDGGARHYAIWDDPFPKPSYLFALVGGDLDALTDRFTTASGRDVTLGIYTLKGKSQKAHYAMDALKRSMCWDEEAYGCEYDLSVFNIVAVPDFNMGAMENKGLNVFNDRYILAEPETATDADYGAIEAIVAHEYFHNWTGNRITCRDWFQLCLKEGLTVYRDQSFSAAMRDETVERISDVRTLWAHQFAEDQGPLAHPVRPEMYREINNFYTATVYEKGAEIVRMVALILGPELYRKGIDLYFTRHDGEAATVEHFIACFAEVSGRDFTALMRWYSQAGTPHLVAEESFAGGSYTLTFTQSTPPTPAQATKQPVPIPVKFALLDLDGKTLATAGAAVTGGEMLTDTFLLSETTGTVRLDGLAAKPVASLLRGFSAPVNLSFRRALEDRVMLARLDTSPFDRWRTINDLVLDHLVDASHGPDSKAVREAVLDRDSLTDILLEAAFDDGLSQALRAQILTLPPESDIARTVGENVDPDAVYQARTELSRALAEQGGDRLLAAIDALAFDGPYDPGARDAGRRALRLAILGHAAHRDAPQARAMTLNVHDNATNMTELFGSLAVLVRAGHPAAGPALARFHDRFANDALVLDKWFTLQASNPRAEALETVKALMRYKAFSFKTPNRVRALIGAFAAMNPTRFNAADGSGYRLVLDALRTLDPINPQIAARILSSFRSYRVLEKGRRELAETLLRAFEANDGLSRDSRDILSRILE